MFDKHVPEGTLSEPMTAVRLHEFGGPEVLSVEEVEVPKPADDEVLVRVRAASVTWWDSGYRRGIVQAPPGRPPLPMPFQLGREGAGDVAEVGRNVRRFKPGDRVVIMTCPACGKCAYCLRGADNLCVDTLLPGHQRFGSYAQYTIVPEHGIIAAPRNTSFEKLACSLWSYGTVLHMVDARARVRPGESVLVTGASSGMGTAGLQLAKLAGAGTVIALTGSPHKANALLASGADVVLDYHDADIQAQIRSHTGGLGVDVVLDNIGGAMVSLAIDAARMGGRIVLASVMGGRTVEMSVADIFRKHLDVLGTRAATRREQERVLELVGAGKIDPVIAARFPLAAARQAHEALDQGLYAGKIVLLP